MILALSSPIAGLAAPSAGSQAAVTPPAAIMPPAAGDSLVLPATLEELLAYAERHSPGLAAARSEWAAARAIVPQERALPDPVLEYGIETRMDPHEQSLMLSQTVPWPGKLSASGRVAAAAAQAQRAEYELRRRELRFEVASAFHTQVYIERAQEIAAEDVALLDRVEAVVRARYRAGTGAQAEILRTQVEIEKMREQTARLADERVAAIARLNALLGRAADASLEIVPGQEEEAPALASEELRAGLLAGNPELQAAGRRVDQRDAGLQRATREAYPDLMLGVRYTGRSAEPGMEASVQDPLMVSVGITLPLWFGRTRAVREQARAERAASLTARQELENRLLGELEEARVAYRDGDRRWALYGQNLVPLAEQSLEVTLKSFATGGAGFVDVIDAQRTLLDLRLAREQAREDRGRARARLEMLAAPASEGDGSGQKR